MEGKGLASDEFTVVKSGSDLSRTQDLEDPDQAYNFLASVHGSKEAAKHVDLRRLRRKIDWYIIPVMFLCYTMQFIDKVSLNVSAVGPEAREGLTPRQYAAVMGLPKDLKLKGNDFSNSATAFFIAYLVAEVPNGKVDQ